MPLDEQDHANLRGLVEELDRILPLIATDSTKLVQDQGLGVASCPLVARPNGFEIGLAFILTHITVSFRESEIVSQRPNGSVALGKIILESTRSARFIDYYLHIKHSFIRRIGSMAYDFRAHWAWIAGSKAAGQSTIGGSKF